MSCTLMVGLRLLPGTGGSSPLRLWLGWQGPLVPRDTPHPHSHVGSITSNRLQANRGSKRASAFYPSRKPPS